MATVSTVAINLIARTQAFERNMKRSRKSFTSMMATVRRTQRVLVGFASTLLAGGGVVFALKSVVRTASDSIETLNKFEGVFKGLSVSAKAWADDFAKSAGRARQDVLRWMATLQDTFVPLGFARDKAAEMSKELVKLAVDVASFQNEADQTVIENFTSALVGQTRAVLKYGIVTNVAALEQQALRDGLQKSFKDLTNLEKVQLRYNVIQRSTRDAQGDVARTTNDWANQMKRLQSNVTTIKELLGARFIQRFNASLINLNNSLQQVTKSQIDAAIATAHSAAKWLALGVSLTTISRVIPILITGFNRLIPAILAMNTGITATTALSATATSQVLLLGVALAALAVHIDNMVDAEIRGIKAGIAAEAQGKKTLKIAAQRRAEAEFTARAERQSLRAQHYAKDPPTAAEIEARQKQQIAAQQKLNALQRDAESITNSLLTPTERFEKDIANLNKLLDAGVLKWDIYMRAVIRARRELVKNIADQDKLRDVTDTRSIGEFREITSSQIDIAGLSAGSITGERAVQMTIAEEAKKQTALLELIALSESLKQAS
jgi:hypothetical protein